MNTQGLNAQKIIELLRLTPHPEEGGHFSETYRCDEGPSASALPVRYSGPRSFGTAIYYLLSPGTFSALHKLESDEIFHFYWGGPVRMLQLGPDSGPAQGREIVIGPDLLAGQRPQVLVPRGVWQGALLEPGSEFALLGCTVSPGFEYADYTHGNRAALLREWPEHAALIHKLTTV
ncbi:MAG: cupin domain-containing protein [Desulfovibrio sp.]